MNFSKKAWLACSLIYGVNGFAGGSAEYKILGTPKVAERIIKLSEEECNSTLSGLSPAKKPDSAIEYGVLFVCFNSRIALKTSELISYSDLSQDLRISPACRVSVQAKEVDNGLRPMFFIEVFGNKDADLHDASECLKSARSQLFERNFSQKVLILE